MKNIVLASLLFASLVAGCKKQSECEQLYDHTLSLLPADMKGKLDQGKAKAIERCEQASPEARKCAADATSLDELMKCPTK